MKNYKEMADAVFARRDEYVAGVKRKKKIALSTGLSLCAICLATLGAIGIWKTGIVEPDSDVLGTRPHYFTESTEQSVNHTLNPHATSEGEHGSTAEVIIPNTQHNSGTTIVNGTNPTQNATSGAEKPPKVTDPAEKPPKVTDPAEKPTDATSAIDKPATNPRPPVIGPVVTEPAETQCPTDGNVDATAFPDSGTDSEIPGKPTDKPATNPRPPVIGPEVTEPVETQCPTGLFPEVPPTGWVPQDPTVPCVTEPCCTEPTEDWAPPTEAPTVSATEPTAGNMVEGKVVDQNGKPVKGAVVMVYSGGEPAGSYVTDNYGYYYISGFRNYPLNLGFGAGEGNYVGIKTLPEGYTNVHTAKNFTGSYNYIVLVCNKD